MSDLNNATEAELEAMLKMRPGEGTAEYIERSTKVREQLNLLKREPDEEEDDDEDNSESCHSEVAAAQAKKLSDEEFEAREREWEKKRLAYAEECEARIVPLTREFPPTATGRWPLPRMSRPESDCAPRYGGPAPVPDDAETELTAIISECRYFMREIAFHSARLTPDAGDRVAFMSSACRLAETGGKVGKVIAKVRGNDAAPVQEHRQRITVEDLRRAARPKEEGGDAQKKSQKAENRNQAVGYKRGVASKSGGSRGKSARVENRHA
jgi:hypothetical protein